MARVDVRALVRPALRVPGSLPLAEALRRFDAGGSIGIDFPTLATKVDRRAVDEALADVVTTKLQRVEGIETTETLIAFRAYSRHDLESAFSLGLD